MTFDGRYNTRDQNTAKREESENESENENEKGEREEKPEKTD